MSPCVPLGGWPTLSPGVGEGWGQIQQLVTSQCQLRDCQENESVTLSVDLSLVLRQRKSVRTRFPTLRQQKPKGWATRPDRIAVAVLEESGRLQPS